MVMAAVAYNLKKYLDFKRKTVESMAKEAEKLGARLLAVIGAILSHYTGQKNSELTLDFRWGSLLKIAYIISIVKQNNDCATGTMASMQGRVRPSHNPKPHMLARPLVVMLIDTQLQ